MATIPNSPTLHLTPRQRRGLFQKARKRKTSFTDELRGAVDLYLELPPEFDEKAMNALAVEAAASAGRSVARLDGAIARLKTSIRKLDAVNRRLDELDGRRI
jgi:hypothetical protein